MNKYLIGFMIIMLIALSACSGKTATKDNVESEDLDNVNDEGMPIVEDEITLDIFAGKAPATADDWNDVLVFNEYEEMTNIDVNWEMVPHEALSERRNLSLAGGGEDLPDAYHSAGIPVTDILKYGQRGTFIPLNDLIDEYAPNFKKILEEYPEIEKAITFSDGNIYSFPLVLDPDFTALHIIGGTWFREDWLDELDMELPETTDEFYEYLKAVKEEDPGNNDAIPFGAASMDDLIMYLEGAFGLSNRGKSQGYTDIDPETGEPRFYPISENYKEMLEFVKKLYDEELIEQNIFTIEPEQYSANGIEGKYASTYDFSPRESFSEEVGENFTGGFALEGPHGDKQFNAISFPASLSGFVITDANEHPAATVRWIDYFYGDEGAKLFFMGVEGETYEVNDDGEYEYVDEIKDNPDLTLDQAVSKYMTWPGGGYPGIIKEEYFKGSEGTPESKEAAEKLEPDFADEVWPSFTYTEEENKIMTTTGADIEKYVDEMRDKFIKGSESLDEWDEYVETIEKMGLEEYMDVQKEAFERFEDN